jgi:hypothetical protein
MEGTTNLVVASFWQGPIEIGNLGAMPVVRQGVWMYGVSMD